jgi:hypothetical protein
MGSPPSRVDYSTSAVSLHGWLALGSVASTAQIYLKRASALSVVALIGLELACKELDQALLLLTRLGSGHPRISEKSARPTSCKPPISFCSRWISVPSPYFLLTFLYLAFIGSHPFRIPWS